jgi:hypothetical protein
VRTPTGESNKTKPLAKAATFQAVSARCIAAIAPLKPPCDDKEMKPPPRIIAPALLHAAVLMYFKCYFDTA